MIWISFLCLAAAAALLLALSIVDLKTRLLPNVMVAPFALLALIFHFATDNLFTPWQDALMGGIGGFGLLYILRAGANYIYKQDALGLGDVKLLGAAGLWLGLQGVMFAMTAGAAFSVLHGVGYGLWHKMKTGEKIDFGKLQIPAGPGFAAGILAAAIIEFRDFKIF